MAESNDWREAKYKEIFEQEIRGINRRLKSDPECKIDDLKGILNNLYILEGADHDGRGTLQDTVLSATIAAYEQIISDLQAEAK
ncbi:MAG: hypothetical protein FWD28_08090 [Treponema sp.]|nr:hypothetical protein [Treponema sp.]